MKTLKLSTLVLVTLAMCLGFKQTSLAQSPIIQINHKLKTDPMLVSGWSGGPKKTNCGNISAKPSQVIEVTESLPYLRLTVESQGQPTLLIDGPGGRLCVLADDFDGNKPEVFGFWQAGQYLLYIGNLSPQQYNYTLSISQQKK